MEIVATLHAVAERVPLDPTITVKRIDQRSGNFRKSKLKCYFIRSNAVSLRV